MRRTRLNCEFPAGGPYHCGVESCGRHLYQATTNRPRCVAGAVATTLRLTAFGCNGLGLAGAGGLDQLRKYGSNICQTATSLAKYVLAKTRAPGTAETTAATRPPACPKRHISTAATREEPENTRLTVRHTLPQWSPNCSLRALASANNSQYGRIQAAYRRDATGAQPDPPAATEPHEQRADLPQLPWLAGI